MFSDASSFIVVHRRSSSFIIVHRRSSSPIVDPWSFHRSSLTIATLSSPHLHAPTVHHPLAQASGLGWHRPQIRHANGGRYRWMISTQPMIEW
jgi:hypothetical protein